MKTLDALVNPFEKLESESPDNIQDFSLGKDPQVDHLANVFKIWEESRHPRPALIRTVFDVLTPYQINMVLQKIKPLPVHPEAKGYFISRLLNNSLVAGYRDFVLDTGDCALGLLSDAIYVHDEKLLNLTVNGNIGDHFGESISNSNLVVNGDVGKLCGYSAFGCNFEILGQIGERSAVCARKCTFKVRNRQAYEKLVSDLGEHHSLRSEHNVTYFFTNKLELIE